MPNATVIAIGARLRSMRTDAELSLNDVADQSGGYFKASCVGAYERGERVIPVDRLVELAEFYGRTPAYPLFGIRVQR